MIYKIPRPEWTFRDFNLDDNLSSMTLEPVYDAIRQKTWEIEDEILTTAVVDILRAKGWTVIEPIIECLESVRDGSQ